MRSYKTILKYFCKKMMQTYCPKLGHTRLPSKQECLEHLIPAIARLWEQEVGELNCAGSFYDALQGKKEVNQHNITPRITLPIPETNKFDVYFCFLVQTTSRRRLASWNRARVSMIYSR